MRKKTRIIKTNGFFKLAQEFAEEATSDADIKKLDMTEEFWHELKQEIINDELIDININAKVRMSKSTIGIHIGQEMYNFMIHQRKLHKKEPFGLKNIVRDQQEYSKAMRDPKTCFTFLVTDEINELEQTGENVTVEQAMNNVFSNVQASRYVHRICCSPKGTTDPNADVFLEVVAVDRKRKITRCYLYYKMLSGGEEYMQLLGYVDFDVSKLIRIWDNKVKKHFMKPNRTDHDKRTISKWRKRDFYVEYMCQKEEKQELITKEGIMKPRILEYAEVILIVEDKLKKIAKFGSLLNRDTMKNYIKMECRKIKIPTSIVGIELMTQEINGILSLRKSYYKAREQVTKERAKKIPDPRKLLGLIEVVDTLNEAIKAQLKELRHYVKINQKYSQFGTSEDAVKILKKKLNIKVKEKKYDDFMCGSCEAYKVGHCEYKKIEVRPTEHCSYWTERMKK